MHYMRSQGAESLMARLDGGEKEGGGGVRVELARKS